MGKTLRRTLLAQWAAGAAVGAAAQPAAAHVRYVSPGGALGAQGRDASSAGRLGELSRFIREVGPGGEIRLLADQGPYQLAELAAISEGGGDRSPVVITGADSTGRARKALCVGDRGAAGHGPQGGEGFRLVGGANALTWRNLSFRDVGNGCFRIAGGISQLTIEACDFQNVYRFIENTASGAADASVRDFAIRACSGAGIERSFLRLRYNSERGVIEDCVADSEGVMGDPFAVGVSFEGAVRSVACTRVTMRNFRQRLEEESYWNGDGFSSERGVLDLHFDACEASGCSDGGFDLKSRTTRLTRCIATDNKRNFRIWGADTRMTGCIGRDPRRRGGSGSQAQVWLAEGASLDIRGGRFEDESEATVVFDQREGASHVAAQSARVRSAGRVSYLGAGAVLDQ